MKEDIAATLLMDTWDEEQFLRPLYLTAEYRRERDTIVRDFRKSVLSERENSRIFTTKIRELELELIEARMEYDSLLRRRAADPNPEAYVYDYFLVEWQARIKEAGLQLKRFRFFHALCLGKQQHQELDLTNARQFPIDEILVMPPLQRQGRIWTYRCPLHTEKTGSFQWYRDTNTWWCFGCHRGRDSIDLYMKLNDADFVTAVRALS